MFVAEVGSVYVRCGSLAGGFICRDGNRQPEKSASAAQMLVKYYDEVGLSTPQNQVPALTSSLPSTIAASRDPPQFLPP